MLLLVFMVIVSVFSFIVMWKASATAIRINKADYDDAHKKAKGLALFAALLLVICLVFLAILLYMKFSPTSRATSSVLSRMF